MTPIGFAAALINGGFGIFNVIAGWTFGTHSRFYLSAACFHFLLFGMIVGRECIGVTNEVKSEAITK